MPRAGEMRFALLDCEDSEKWRGHEEIWLRLFKREGDEWDVFRVYNGELPSNSQYKGILITGSHYSCYDELPWIEPLSQYLHDLHSKPEDSRPKVCTRKCTALFLFGCAIGSGVVTVLSENPIIRTLCAIPFYSSLFCIHLDFFIISNHEGVCNLLRLSSASSCSRRYRS